MQLVSKKKSLSLGSLLESAKMRLKQNVQKLKQSGAMSPHAKKIFEHIRTDDKKSQHGKPHPYYRI